MVICPECDAELQVDEDDVELGDDFTCPDCGQELTITNLEPLEVDFALLDDDEDDDEDSDGDEESLDEDEDGEDDDEGWDEE